MGAKCCGKRLSEVLVDGGVDRRLSSKGLGVGGIVPQEGEFGGYQQP